MEHDLFIIARSIHVIAIVFWIGGVAFVTSILIPSLRRTQSPENRSNLFEQLEGRFSFQAKITTLITGLSGFYMVYVMNAWSSMPGWIHLMIMIWAVFSLVLFVFEPLFLHKWFHKQAQKNSDRTFFVLQVMHLVLLLLSIAAVFGGVAGVHGLFY